MYHGSRSYAVVSLICVLSLLMGTLPVQGVVAQSAASQSVPQPATDLAGSLPSGEPPSAVLSAPGVQLPQPGVAPRAALESPTAHNPATGQWELLPARPPVPMVAVADPVPPVPMPVATHPGAVAQTQLPFDSLPTSPLSLRASFSPG